MSKNKQAFLVLELGTGLVDGWYMGRDDAIRMKGHWDDCRPHQHVVVQLVAAGGDNYLPDTMMMNRAPEDP